jgi:hypothetical protein
VACHAPHRSRRQRRCIDHLVIGPPAPSR